MRSTRSVALALVLALLAAACSRNASAIDEAKKKQAAGDLESALALLQSVRAGAAGSSDEAEAAKLATGWLLEAAAKAPAVEDRRRRLEEAIAWTPTSGEATARLCLTMVDQGDDALAEKCLAERLPGKTAVPEPVVKEARTKLDTRKEEAAARDRAALLASGRPAQLKALIERWPDSKEAGEAKTRLARVESLCGDLPALNDDLTAQIAHLEKLGAEAEAARKTEIAPRLDAYERIGKEAGGLAGPLKNKGIEAEAHPAKPGEERLAKALHDGYWRLSDLAGDAGDGLAKPAAESDESYDQHASRVLAGWGRNVKQASEKLRKDVDAAAADCPRP